MVSSKDHLDISPSNILKPTIENQSAEDRQEFEEYKRQLIEEAEAKYLANFKMDKHQKIVKQGEIEM
jgi:hypothetical protein